MHTKSFTIGGAFREGWELTKINIGFLVVYQIILFFLLWLFNSSDGAWRLNPIHIIGWIIVSLGKMGFYNSALLLTKGLKPSFDQLYVNWQLLLSWVIAGFLFMLLFGIGLVLLIIPGLFVWAIFGMYPFFILDKGLGPLEALKKSAEATQGVRIPLLLFFLACIGLDLLGILLFGIGILITSPITLIAMAVVYRKITGQSQTSIQPDDIISPSNE